MEHVLAKLDIPIYADGEGKRAGELSGNLLAAFGHADNNGDQTKYGNGPKQQLSAARFLEVKAGNIAPEKVCPRQKEADAQTSGAQIDQLRPAQADGLISLCGGGGGGFRFRFNGDFVRHNDFALIFNADAIK